MSKKASAAALKKFEEMFAKTFGEGSISRSAVVNPYDVISTGSLTLDYRLSVGGYVEGRLVEVWGPEGVGKTRLTLLGIAEAQRKYPDKMAAFIDMEQKLDLDWAERHGVDLERLYVISPESAEDVADALKEVCRSGLFSIAVLDSIGAMIPEAEKDKDAGDAVVGKQANIVTRMVKIAAVEARKTSTVVIFINQVRANLGYGADTTTGGGFALKHATTMKLRMRRSATPPLKVKIGDEERVVGHEVAIIVERNGVANAFRTAMVTMIHVPTEKYGPIGIDRVDEAATLGISTGVIERAGAWYTLPGDKRVQGREGVLKALREDADLLAAVTKAVMASVASEINSDEDVDAEPDFDIGVPQ